MFDFVTTPDHNLWFECVSLLILLAFLSAVVVSVQVSHGLFVQKSVYIVPIISRSFKTRSLKVSNKKCGEWSHSFNGNN